MARRKKKITSDHVMFGMRPIGGTFPDGSFDVIIGGSRVRIGPDSDFEDDDARELAESMIALNLRMMNPRKKIDFGALMRDRNRED